MNKDNLEVKFMNKDILESKLLAMLLAMLLVLPVFPRRQNWLGRRIRKHSFRRS
jgi:hypothetical protein